ncbi:12976_t:CDS:1, partial [Cetraspora pellucida]
ASCSNARNFLNDIDKLQNKLPDLLTFYSNQYSFHVSASNDGLFLLE